MKKFLASLALLSVELIIVLILFVISLVCFFYITEEVIADKNNAFDQQVFQSIVPYITETNTRIIRVITFFASHYFLLPANILLALYFLLIKKHRWYVVRVPVVSLGSFLVMALLKLFFSRPRPSDPVYRAAVGFSYPSGHAMSAMTFYGLLIYLVWKTDYNKKVKWLLTVLLSIFIVLIGFSRIYLRLHYASDVLAGFSMGLVWLVLCLWIMKKIENYTAKKIAPVVNEQAE